MRLKDVEAGKVYASLSWGRHDRRHVKFEDWEGRDLERAAETAHPVLVLEVGVPVATYRRPGILVRRLDRESMEPKPSRREGEGEGFDDYATHAVNLIAEWDVLHARLHDWMDETAENAAQAAEEHEREKARKQEAAAQRWMADVFARAKQDIEQVREVISVAGPETTDDEVRALVGLRYPEGNPYLNGEREAF